MVAIFEIRVGGFRSKSTIEGLCAASERSLLARRLAICAASPEHGRAFCSKVRSITTDMGTERLIVTSPEFLMDVLQVVDPKFHPGPDAPPDFQFPWAVAVPGWKHAWDLLLQKGLSSLRWFPGWLRGLKAIVACFRSQWTRQTVGETLAACKHGWLG